MLSGQTFGRLDSLFELARKAGVAKRLHHIGYLQPDEIPALLRRARALIFPSLFEGFGLPPLEAMACGCPVACSDRGSLPEVVGERGLRFDPTSVEEIASAIDRITSDERCGQAQDSRASSARSGSPGRPPRGGTPSSTGARPRSAGRAAAPR